MRRLGAEALGALLHARSAERELLRPVPRTYTEKINPYGLLFAETMGGSGLTPMQQDVVNNKVLDALATSRAGRR